MEALLGTILALIIVATLLYPFLSRRNRSDESADRATDSPHTAPDSVNRERIYAEILTIRTDFEAGYLTRDEYQNQLAELKNSAARALRQEERARIYNLEAELSIEHQIRLARDRARANSDEAI